MPEGPEIRIMSDFINHNSKSIKFESIYQVEKGNKPYLFSEEIDTFDIISTFHGKKLILNIKSQNKQYPIYVFMGMSGSWSWVDTDNWSETKYTRLKFDSTCGKSLLLHGGYLGPKYSFYRNFKNSKNGPDIVQEFDEFVTNINLNIDKKEFQKPIYELLLDQKYFAGVGNYLRSTILYYSNDNPFESAREVIRNNPNILNLCKDILEKSYHLNGGQLKDWTNPFQKSSSEFENWVYYQKGNSIKDSQGRTFWYNPKWSK